jgi:hypothetical protein
MAFMLLLLCPFSSHSFVLAVPQNVTLTKSFDVISIPTAGSVIRSQCVRRSRRDLVQVPVISSSNTGDHRTTRKGKQAISHIPYAARNDHNASLNRKIANQNRTSTKKSATETIH